MTNYSIDNIELIQKILLIISGLFVLFFKVKSYFSLRNFKQDLKQDIEILELLKKQNNPNTEHLDKKINDDLKRIYENEIDASSRFSGFILGLTFFIGFGWWSISIYNSSPSFNGWIILSMFLAFSGFSMILMDTSPTKKKEPFFIIGFYDKINIRVGLIFSLVSGFILWILLIKLDSFSPWEILLGCIFIYGGFMIYKNIKRLK